MYSYVGFWNIPRAQWAEMDKNTALDQKVLDKALADGAIVLCDRYTQEGMTGNNDNFSMQPYAFDRRGQQGGQLDAHPVALLQHLCWQLDIL